MTREKKTREKKTGKIVIVNSDLVRFHHAIKPGDRVLIMRPGRTAYGVYEGPTPHRFNLDEQCIDLTDAALIPSALDPSRPRQTLNLVESLRLPRDSHTFPLGQVDFLAVKRT